MGSARTQPLGLRALRHLGWRGEPRTTTLAGSATLPALTTGAVTVTASTTTVALTATIATAGTVVTTTLATGALGARLDDRIELRVGGEELEATRVISALTASDDGEHLDPVETLFDLDAQGRSDRCVRREDVGGHGALRLPGTGGSPGPGPIGLGTRQLDVDPAGHGAQRYRRRMPIYALAGTEPSIDSSAYIHPDAVIIGDVRIGAESSVWPGAVLRGDDGYISIGARTSIQDNSVLHTTPADPTVVGDDCVIGHIVHLEGCEVEDGAMVGNGAMVLHRSVVGSGAIVAANSVVLYDVHVPPGALAVGSPATVKEGRARSELISLAAESYRLRAGRFHRELRRLD